MKENIHIVKSTISSFNSTISKLNQNEIKLNSQINKLNEVLSQVTDNNNNLVYLGKLNNFVNIIEGSLLTTSNFLDSIINSILFAKVNILHPSVLSPMNLFKELSKRSNSLNKRLDFPVPLSIENIHTLVDVSNLISYFYNNRIVFVIQIPLVSLNKFDVYKTIPLPTPHDRINPSTFALITPTKPYIALTADKLYYTFLDDIRHCPKISNDNSICPLESIYSTLANPSCETKLLTEVTLTLPSECNSKLIYGLIDIWQKLENNKWIFVQSKTNKLTIKCNEQLKDYSISGTGILTLDEQCIGYSKTIQLTPSTSVSTQINNQFKIDFSITEDDCCDKEIVNKTVSLLSPVSLTNIDLDSLKYSYRKLDNLEQNINKAHEQTHFVKYGNYYSTATILTLTMIFLYLAYKLYSCLKGRKNSSSCCIQIFNQCNTKRLVNTESKIHNSIELTDISEEDNKSTKSLPENISFYKSKLRSYDSNLSNRNLTNY